MKVRMKYVAFSSRSVRSVAKKEYIIPFPEYITHSELAGSIEKLSNGALNAISAGFIKNGNCYGDSISLDMVSRGKEDTELLMRLLTGYKS
tara:strand:+ start:735 stop:1007 length:273 start_codon:yes stop_codon:yes gene_type:complete